MTVKKSGQDPQTIAITGASHGIGKSLSLALASKGVNLVINARGGGELERTGQELESKGAKVKIVVGDASRASVAADMAEQAGALGNFMGFVHAAGALRPGPYLWEMEEADFREVVDASLTAAYQMIRFLVPELRKLNSGFAVFFGSGAADLEAPGIGTYCVAKAAEESLARQLATEAPDIASIIFRPGMVDTRMHEQARNAKGGAGARVSSQFKAYKQMGYLADPDQVAKDLADLLEKDLTPYSGKIVSWPIQRADTMD
jgi:NAD(P)-dependent dehydrogenase (short-subunit alcohol dehydrogenase family)